MKIVIHPSLSSFPLSLNFPLFNSFFFILHEATTRMSAKAKKAVNICEKSRTHVFTLFFLNVQLYRFSGYTLIFSVCKAVLWDKQTHPKVVWSVVCWSLILVCSLFYNIVLVTSVVCSSCYCLWHPFVLSGFMFQLTTVNSPFYVHQLEMSVCANFEQFHVFRGVSFFERSIFIFLIYTFFSVLCLFSFGHSN